MSTTAPQYRTPSPLAALAGVAAGAAGLGAGELLAGLLPGAASPVVAVGDLIIALQPPGAKQFVVDLFGEADKLLLNLGSSRSPLRPPRWAGWGRGRGS